ncbi:MAG: hypothetical protein JW881_10420 [Spirochaetales bacterium]|nr:hypothetical protein [Spirochaetales bacterium]
MTLTAIEKRNDLFIEEMEDVNLMMSRADADFWAGVAVGAGVALIVVGICC